MARVQGPFYFRRCNQLLRYPPTESEQVTAFIRLWKERLLKHKQNIALKKAKAKLSNSTVRLSKSKTDQSDSSDFESSDSEWSEYESSDFDSNSLIEKNKPSCSKISQ